MSSTIFRDGISGTGKDYRQHDPEFINLLNSIRNKSITGEGLEMLNRRYQPDFEPSPRDFYVYLTTTNAMASSINTIQLNKLARPLHLFIGEIEGEFGDEYLPTAIELKVKVGAQIMMLNNDADGRWVNGTIGEITDIVQDANGERIDYCRIGIRRKWKFHLSPGKYIAIISKEARYSPR